MTAVANFSSVACTTLGVKPSEPLLFTCEVYGIVILQVVFPTGDQESIGVGDTTADVALPAGFTAESLNIIEVDGSTRNFKLTLSITSASLLNSGEIKCDDTTSRNEAKAKCPVIGVLSSLYNKCNIRTSHNRARLHQIHNNTIAKDNKHDFYDAIPIISCASETY